jgi:undecaprenyl-diphosphatase
MLSASIIGHPVVTSLGGLAVILWAAINSHPTVLDSFILAEIVFVLSGILKLVVHRARPNTSYAKQMRFQTYSFPSGHTFGSIVIFGLLGYVASRHLLGSFDDIVAVLSFLLIALVGVSRIYLGAHYPTDVLAGWALGAVSLLLIIEVVFA